jgi:hypothetical protein
VSAIFRTISCNIEIARRPSTVVSREQEIAKIEGIGFTDYEREANEISGKCIFLRKIKKFEIFQLSQIWR